MSSPICWRWPCRRPDRAGVVTEHVGHRTVGEKTTPDRVLIDIDVRQRLAIGRGSTTETLFGVNPIHRYFPSGDTEHGGIGHSAEGSGQEGVRFRVQLRHDVRVVIGDVGDPPLLQPTRSRSLPRAAFRPAKPTPPPGSHESRLVRARRGSRGAVQFQRPGLSGDPGLPGPARFGRLIFPGVTVTSSSAIARPLSSSSPSHVAGADDVEASGADVGIGDDWQSADLLPAQPLDLEGDSSAPGRRKGAGGVVMVNRLRDRLEVLRFGRAHAPDYAEVSPAQLKPESVHPFIDSVNGRFSPGGSGEAGADYLFVQTVPTPPNPRSFLVCSVRSQSWPAPYGRGRLPGRPRCGCRTEV